MTNATQSSTKLVDTALAMIADVGLDALSLTALAARAGVSRATAYSEFGGKNGLISAVVRTEVGRMVRARYEEVDVLAPTADLAKPAVVFALRC